MSGDLPGTILGVTSLLFGFKSVQLTAHGPVCRPPSVLTVSFGSDGTRFDGTFSHTYLLTDLLMTGSRHRDRRPGKGSGSGRRTDQSPIRLQRVSSELSFVGLESGLSTPGQFDLPCSVSTSDQRPAQDTRECERGREVDVSVRRTGLRRRGTVAFGPTRFHVPTSWYSVRTFHRYVCPRGDGGRSPTTPEGVPPGRRSPPVD